MDGELVLIAVLADSETTGLLFGESGGPHIQVSLMEFLSGIHKDNLLEKDEIA